VNNKAHSIYHDLTVSASATDVFDSVNKHEHLVNWWPLKCSGQPTLGATYNFNFGPEYSWFGKVVGYEPNKSFHIKMTQADPDWEPTTFGFDIQELEGKVHLQFWHVGWPECNAHFKRSSFCWAMLLNGLKNYLEKGIVIPFEERE
jgi:uncharacterized protein YndB with AHSA1/START domain